MNSIFTDRVNHLEAEGAYVVLARALAIGCRVSAGETIQLFFSYRYTPDRIRGLLASHGLQLVGEWFVSSGEEGVFLFTRG